MATTAARLRKLADKMTDQIDAKRNSAIGDQNWTHRRANIAAGMAREADRMERIQYALYGLAGAHEGETIHPLLTKVTNKAVIETMLLYESWPNWDNHIKRVRRAGLEPDTYVEARAALLDLADPPDRSQERKHRELENKARELIGQIPGYFPTPLEVIRQMQNYADGFGQLLRVLEPSAGAGHIVDALREDAQAEHWTIHVIELSPPLQELLTMKGYQVVAHDFLEFQPDQGYDRILMNPPFEQAQDIAHVRHAYECLIPGGRLVSVMSEGTFFRNGPAAEFREWLDELGSYVVDLPADAFKSSGTGVKTRLVVIDKPPDPDSAWTQLTMEVT